MIKLSIKILISLVMMFSLTLPLKASLIEEQREKLLAFSAFGKTRLANLSIKYNCSIDDLLTLMENINLNGGNGNLQQDVDGLLVVMGNIPGATLTTKGTSIKNTIHSDSLTIALGLAAVTAELEGAGDFHTRARALQQRLQTLQTLINQARIAVYGNNAPDLIPAIQAVQNIIPGVNLMDGAQQIVAARDQALDDLNQAQNVITQARTDVNVAAPSLSVAMTQLRAVVNPAADSNILLTTQQIVAARDQALDDLNQAQNVITQARTDVNAAAPSLSVAMTQLRAVVNPAADSNILLTTQQIIQDRDQALDDLNQAQNVITQARTDINLAALSLPEAMTQLRAVVNPAADSNILLTTQQIVADRDQALDDLNQAQNVITQARTDINLAALSLPEAMTQLRTVVNPAADSNILLTTQQIIADRDQALEDYQTMQQGVQNLINIITNNVAGAFRTQGAFPNIPPTGLNNLSDIATYINNINS